MITNSILGSSDALATPIGISSLSGKNLFSCDHFLKTFTSNPILRSIHRVQILFMSVSVYTLKNLNCLTKK